MTIFVDEMVNNLWKLRGKIVKNCHMWSDQSTEELLEFAESIGLKKGWLQRSRKGLVHFDLVERLREKAIKKGALPVTNQRAVEMWRMIITFENAKKRHKNEPN